MPAKNRILVTGGAGFIGSNLIDCLLEKGNKVIVFDNLSSGKMEFIEHHLENPDFSFVKGDLLDPEAIESACKDADMVCHVAANPDVKLGASDTKVHLDQNILATYNLLEAMRKGSAKRIAFTSTSTVYGEASIMPTPENYGPLFLYPSMEPQSLPVKLSLLHTLIPSTCRHGFSVLQTLSDLAAHMGLLSIL